MKPATRIAALEARLEGIMQRDAAWCRKQLAGVRRLLQRGQPVGRGLERIEARIEQSAAEVEARQARAPRPDYDPALPITAHREELVRLIREHPVIVVAGETGSGKTTQLPKLCLEAGRGRRGLIGCTQPRRIAARAMAERVSEELGTALGSVVGYQVRFRDRSDPSGFIKFMTDGILLAQTAQDPWLDAYDTLIVDEAHERSLNIDFLLGYLRQLIERRPELRVIVTSATIDTAKFSKHFGDAPIVEVSGRGYPVETRYRPLAEDSGDRDLYHGIADAVREVSKVDPRGDVLVFLSGEKEIREARDHLARAGLKNTEVLPLFARLSGAEQHRVFHPGSARRVVLATNVAETSLTVPRIRFVVDSGLARISRYSHSSRVQRLPIEPVSQASADQRAGRCGRLGPGVCIRLYSEEDYLGRPEYTEPEILRTSLASVTLRMLCMGLGEIEDFPFIDPPAPRMIRDGYRLLEELGAIDARRRPTKLGRQLSGWPMDVRLARMIMEGDRRGCLPDLLVLAAALSIQDPRERPLDAQQAADEAHERFADPKSDFAALLKLWEYLRAKRREVSGNQFRKLCGREFLAWQRVLEWFDLYQQLRDQAREEGLSLQGGHGDYEAVHQALLSGLLSHVGRRHPEEPSYQGTRGRNFRVFPGSGLFGRPVPWVMAAEIVETTRTWGRIVARIEPEWIETLGAHLLSRQHFEPHWSRKAGRVMCWEQVSLQGLVVVERRRVPYAPIDPAHARQIFILEALVRGDLGQDAPFLRHNAEVREQLEQLEHKRRRRDVLADEDTLVAFYNARLPQEVADAHALAAWLKKASREELQRLEAGLDVLLREDAGDAPGEQFPDELRTASGALPLEYRFDPGSEADGVTVTVPLAQLNTLSAADVDWLVPGLLRERVIEMIRGLPKPKRRALAPAPQFAEAALEAIGEDRQRPLADALAAALSRLARIELEPGDFDEDALPGHLRMRIRVLDEDGGEQAVARDLAMLQERFGQHARRAFMDRQDPGLARDGETEWVFGELPGRIETDGGVTAWPALVDQHDAVGLRLFDTADDAREAHAAGVLRLLALQLAGRLAELQRHHGLSREAQGAWLAWGDVASLAGDLAWSTLEACSEGRWRVRDEAAFDALLQRCRGCLGQRFRERGRALDDALQRAGAVRRALAAGELKRLPDTRADLQSQLDDLLYAGVLRDLSPGRLQHYPRYVEAMQQRCERAPLDPAADARRMAEVQPWWQRYLDHIAAGGVYDPAVDRFRWLIEEYRVSLFAQPLGTDGKVSPKRLRDAWDAVVASRG